MQISLQAATEIRRFAIQHNKGYSYTAATIEVIEGWETPHFIGNSFRWETKSGKPVYHPNAYRRAWGKPIYIPSTRRIVVGQKWLAQLEKDLLQIKLSRQRGRLVDRSIVDFIFNFEDAR
jgi:hypothetical protein